MGCATGTVRLLLFIVNFVFALTGLALLVIGIIYQLNLTQFTSAIPDDFQSLKYASVLTIVVGSVVFVIAFLGCCGALRESVCMLTLFAVILLALFIGKVAIGTFAFIQVSSADDPDGIKTLVNKHVSELVRTYSSQNASRETMDLIQQELQCCGANSSADYLNNGESSIPSSCCLNPKPVCSDPYPTGCTVKLTEYLTSIMHIIGWVVLGTAAVELISAIFALCLSSSIRNESRRQKY